MILKPTRETATTVSFTGDVFTNKYSIIDIIVQGISAADILDHYKTFHISDKCSPDKGVSVNQVGE